MSPVYTAEVNAEIAALTAEGNTDLAAKAAEVAKVSYPGVTHPVYGLWDELI